MGIWGTAGWIPESCFSLYPPNRPVDILVDCMFSISPRRFHFQLQNCRRSLGRLVQRSFGNTMGSPIWRQAHHCQSQSGQFFKLLISRFLRIKTNSLKRRSLGNFVVLVLAVLLRRSSQQRDSVLFYTIECGTLGPGVTHVYVVAAVIVIKDIVRRTSDLSLGTGKFFVFLKIRKFEKPETETRKQSEIKPQSWLNFKPP